MPRAVHVLGRIWAVSPQGNLRHCDASSADSWQDVNYFQNQVTCIAACELRYAVFVACRDGSLHLFNAQTCDLLLSAPDPLHATPLCLLALPFENALFVGLEDGAVVRMHLASLAFDCMLGCGVEHSAAVKALEADEMYLYSGGEDAVVLVWDLKDAMAVREISMPSAPIHSLLRNDVALWVGESDGIVQVFDIFGDDSNGIELVSEKTPHVAPVTELVKVGDTEIWSLATPLDQEKDTGKSASCSLAVWDTRDYSFSVSDDDHASDVIAVTIVCREPFEKVKVLTLSNSFGPTFVSKNVRGSCTSHVATSAPDYDYSDFEEEPLALPVDATETNLVQEQVISTSSAHPQLSLPEALAVNMSDNAPILDMSIQKEAKGQEDVHSYTNGICDSSPHLTGREASPFVLPRSVSETLQISLRRVSELLVTLLTDDVLSPLEGHTRGSSDDLRGAVAKITEELNIGRQLVESCAAGHSSNNSVITVDENEVSRNAHTKVATCCETENARLRKQLERELDKNRILKKDLSVVTKERDLLAEDLLHVKSQSETTLSSLEGLIRDNDSRVASKNALVVELRKECKHLQSKYQAEVDQREKIQHSLDEEIDKLSRAFEASAKSAEEQLTTAYDKIETKSIEIQSLKESIRAMERSMESLRTANTSLGGKCKAAEDEIARYAQEIEVTTKDFALQSAAVQRRHEENVSKLQAEHEAALQREQTAYEEAIQRKRSELLAAKEKSTQDEVEQAAAREEVQKKAEQLREMEGKLGEKHAEMELANEKHKEQLKHKESEWEQKVSDAKVQTEHELKLARDQHIVELQHKQTRIDQLESEVGHLKSSIQVNTSSADDLQREVNRMQDEKRSLEQELNHRVAAADLYEQELEKLKAAEANLRGAAEELQDAVDLAEVEIADLRNERDRMREEFRAKEVHKLASEQEKPGEDTLISEAGVVDNHIAMKALLASANGEIEQMSNQLEAMHRAHRAQERELAELRAALPSPARVRLRDPERLSKEMKSWSEPDEAADKNSHEMSFTNEAASVSSEEADDENEQLVNSALQEVQEGMAETKYQLRELSSTARKYKRSALSHMEILPALCELEGELVRVSKEDGKKAQGLACARGIVQSVIAQYYTCGEKRAVLSDYDENAYGASSQRLEALRKTVARLRAERIGVDASSEPLVEAIEIGEATELGTPKRLLTF